MGVGRMTEFDDFETDHYENGGFVDCDCNGCEELRFETIDKERLKRFVQSKVVRD